MPNHFIHTSVSLIPKRRCISTIFCQIKMNIQIKMISFHLKNVDTLTPRVTRWWKWAGENWEHHATSPRMLVLQPMTDVDTRHRHRCAAVVPLLCCCCYWPQHSPQHRNISIIDHLTIYSVKTDINFVNAFHKILFPYLSITPCFWSVCFSLLLNPSHSMCQ